MSDINNWFKAYITWLDSVLVKKKIKAKTKGNNKLRLTHFLSKIKHKPWRNLILIPFQCFMFSESWKTAINKVKALLVNLIVNYQKEICHRSPKFFLGTFWTFNKY